MITPEEAQLVLNKLRSEKSVVACLGSLFGWKLTMRGRISAISKSEVTFTSLDGRAEIALRLNLDDTFFEYREPKDLLSSALASVPKAALDASGLIVALPLRVPLSALEEPSRVPFREKLCFVEIPVGAE